MKLLILARSLEAGGAERQIVLLARGLAERGLDVTLALFYAGGTMQTELVGSGVAVVDLAKGGRWSNLAFLVRLVRLLRRKRPDALYSFLPVANLVAAVACLTVPGCRLVFGVRASDMDLSRYDRLSALSYRLEGVAARRADLAIANSEAGRVAALARGFPASRLVVVPNGVDTERFHPDHPAGEALRLAWGIPAEAPLIGLVGRLDPMKGHAVFLAAVALMAARRPDLRFVCVGDGPEAMANDLRDQAERLGLSGRLTWHRAVPRPEEVYAMLDLLVSASLYGEGFSNVVGEAMACGVPVVATAVGDSAQVVGEAGTIVPPGDAEALAEACLARFDTPPATAPRDRIEARFGVAAMVERTEALLGGPADTRPTILHVITGLGGGGAERTLAQVVTGSDPRRFRQVVVSLTDGGRWQDVIRDAGVATMSLGMRRGVPSPLALVRLARLIRAQRPTVVMTWLYHADLLGTLAVKLAGCDAALVWNLRCSEMEPAGCSPATALVRRVLAALSGLPDVVAANSQAGRLAHQRRGYRPRRWEILPNGVDPSVFHPDGDARRRLRQELSLGPEAVAVGVVARLDPMKGHDDFIAAAIRVAAALPQAVFVLAGTGVPSLAERIAATGLAFRFRLLAERSDPAALMAALDVPVVSSRFGEGFPNVVAEAMACGRACVVTDVGDAAAMVGATGLVVPPSRPDLLAEAILRLAGDGALRARMGAEAARAAAAWSLDTSIAAYRDFTLGLVQSRRK